VESTNSPALYEINARVWLGELGRATGLGRIARLDEVPEAEIDRLAAFGFDWIWLLGIWQTGPAGRRVSASNPEWGHEYRRVLPDLRDPDVSGSCFAIHDYDVHDDFGGTAALAKLRRRLADRGMKLMLDFVPNHMAPDHPWVVDHPEFFVHGTEADLDREPANYARVGSGRGPVVIAYGRDPYFPGWPDTLQLNYRHAGFRAAMIGELERIAGQCDGVRCDMAMLVLPEIFTRTWGDRSSPADGSSPVDSPFWPEAIGAVRADHPGFTFMAEAYWDLEWALQQQGFDYTYDKRLYDRLRGEEVWAVRGHLHADLAFQSKSARFLENHDEPRAADAFPPDVHRAAAVLTFLAPGLRFFHEGEFEGRRVRLPVHLGRRPDEPKDGAIAAFYDKLLAVLRRPEARGGSWRLLDARPAWDGNPSWERFVGYRRDLGDSTLIVAVNYGPGRGQCYLDLGDPTALRGRAVRLTNLIGDGAYDRDGDDLAAQGLYLDEPGWSAHVFEVARP